MGEVIRLDQVRAQLDAEAAATPSPPPEEYEEDIAGFNDTDIANAQRFARQHGENARITPERGRFIWDGTRWAIDEKMIHVPRSYTPI